MQRARLVFSLIWLAAAAVPGAEPSPGFQEIFSLIRSNLAGAKSDELERAAVRGLLQQLQPQVLMATNAADAGAAGEVVKTNLFDEAFAYLRVSRVNRGLTEQVKASLDRLAADKKFKGLVLDLRFARGQDYAVAVAVADQFIATDKPQLSVGTATLRSTTKTNAVAIPMVVLVNRETAGAAEALAALLRQNKAALLIGGATAGEAYAYKEFPLAGGQRLRIATGTVKLGDGSAMPAQGVTPDIATGASAADERAWQADPYKDLSRGGASPGAGAASSSTNNVRKRINEAELVRRQREGQNPDEESPVLRPRETEPVKPLVRDPALARAIDLLKGLAVVRQFRAP